MKAMANFVSSKRIIGIVGLDGMIVIDLGDRVFVTSKAAMLERAKMNIYDTPEQLIEHCPCEVEPSCDPCRNAPAGYIDRDGQPVEPALGKNRYGGLCFAGCVCFGTDWSFREDPDERIERTAMEWEEKRLEDQGLPEGH